MANDSIIARPTNKVRVMVAALSGCCAREDRAIATARPSPSAGPMQPIPMVKPAVTIDASAMRVVLSMGESLFARGRLSAGGCADVHRGENAEYIGLDHAGEQTERRHDERKEIGRDREQDADDHHAAHHVAEQAN